MAKCTKKPIILECGTLLVHLDKAKARKLLFFNGFQAFCNYSNSITTF
uniref:Uncharacterized protein n=1 Tax=Myoviridae sp. ct3Oc10 TaxID=2825025 RepID=A0A8S5U729_9CAUD|nr:MAG TPA: hypothetical protein [Myoviridae sp. ct3Oc10]